MFRYVEIAPSFEDDSIGKLEYATKSSGKTQSLGSESATYTRHSSLEKWQKQFSHLNRQKQQQGHT